MTGRRRTSTPELDAERLMSGAAWADFCDRLKLAGQHVLAPGTPDSPLERAEGFRYLAGLVVSGLRQGLELSDPDLPRFLRNPDSICKWGAENADNQYLWTRIRSQASYRITGRRASAYAFLIETLEGYMQLGEHRGFATLHSGQLEIGPGGSFEIILSAEEHTGNWMPLHPDARYLVIRQFFQDWENEEPAEFRIVQIGNEGGSPPRLQPARMAEILDAAGEWTEVTAGFWNEWVAQLRAGYRRNSLAQARHYIGGADDILYGNDVYRLTEDEALLIEGEPPRARYWSFQLCNLWFESLDYANRSTSLNGHQAHINADGRFRCVIAHRDPGVPNWLDTGGHHEGIIQYRWVWSENNPRPEARVVPWRQIRELLPEDTPHVGANARRKMLCVRQEHVARRER